MAEQMPKGVSVGKEIHSLDNMVGRYIDLTAGKEEKKIDGISGNNGRILCYIARNDGRDVYQRDIETEFCITRSTASKVLTLMEEKGLIERHRVPQDARLKKLVLTDKSKAFAKKMRKNMLQMESALTEGISDEELAAFISTAEKMKGNIRRKMR